MEREVYVEYVVRFCDNTAWNGGEEFFNSLEELREFLVENVPPDEKDFIEQIYSKEWVREKGGIDFYEADVEEFDYDDIVGK